MCGHEEALQESWWWRGSVLAGGDLRTRLLFSTSIKEASQRQQRVAGREHRKHRMTYNIQHAACTNMHYLPASLHYSTTALDASHTPCVRTHTHTHTHTRAHKHTHVHVAPSYYASPLSFLEYKTACHGSGCLLGSPCCPVISAARGLGNQCRSCSRNARIMS